MKEAAAAVLVRHDVDRPAWASSASSESGSLELLLTLDALVGAAILRRTNGCSIWGPLFEGVVRSQRDIGR